MAYVFRPPPPIFRLTLAQRTLATMTVAPPPAVAQPSGVALGSANAMVL